MSRQGYGEVWRYFYAFCGEEPYMLDFAIALGPYIIDLSHATGPLLKYAAPIFRRPADIKILTHSERALSRLAAHNSDNLSAF